MPVVVLGGYNRRRLVPAMSPCEPSESSSERTMQRGSAAPEQLRARLGRIVSAELVLLLAVVGVTSVLVTRSPIASSSAPPPATAVPPEAVELPLSGDAGTVLFTVAPDAPGRTRSPSPCGTRPGSPSTRSTCRPSSSPSRPSASGRCARSCTRSTVGEYHVIADIPLAGTYEMVVRVRVSDFEAATAETTLTIG